MHIHRKITRRQLLGGAAAATALTPFVPMLESHAGAATPKRLVILNTPAGTIMPRWQPTGSTDNWALSELLEPLAAHKSDLIVLDGVDNEAVHHGVQPGTGGHRSIASLWTGVPEVGVSEDTLWGGGISLDQYVASIVGSQTLFPSLEFGVDIRDDVTALHRMSYTGASQPVDPIGDPQTMFANIFGDLDLDESQFERLQAGRLSVLDAVAGSLDSLNARVSKGDQAKIDQHLTALREIELQVQAGPAECSIPDIPPLTPLPNFENYPAQTDQMIDMMVESLACDVTRVATLMWSWENSSVRFPWLPLSGGETRFHPLSHMTDSPDFRLQMLWYAEKVASLIQKLAERTDSDGQRLLDNTVVVWGSACGVSHKHISRSLPIVMAGSCGGYFQTDRYHKWGNYNFDAAQEDPHGGRTMNDLCISLLHAMGIDDDTFGSPEFCTGPLL